MKNLAICVPTYQRSDIIDKFLNDGVNNFNEFNIDVYIFDSSIDENTKKVVEKYMKLSNIYYVKMDTSLSSAEKVFLIYQQFENSEYEYLWMTHDHTEIKNEALQIIFNALDKNADFYSINLHSSREYNEIMRDLNEFMIKSAWILNRFGTAIISVKRVIKGTNWDYMIHKYMKKSVSNYSHVGFYLERISEIENAKCFLLGVPHEYFYDYTRCEKRSWDNDTLRITTECWGKIIYLQTSKYSKKAKKITLKSIGKTEITQYKLIKMKKEGQYKFIIFLKYYKWLNKMFRKRDLFSFFLISIMPFKYTRYFFDNRIKELIGKEQKKGYRIVIYGAGKFASECSDKLKNANVNYDGFIVKTKKDNPDKLYNHNVYIAEDYLKKNDSFIIIAVSIHGMKEVKEYLKQIKTEKKMKFVESGDL